MSRHPSPREALDRHGPPQLSAAYRMLGGATPLDRLEKKEDQ